MKNKIIIFILLCFYQAFSFCDHYYQDFLEIETLLPSSKRDLYKAQCTSLQLTDKEKEKDLLGNIPDSCCTIILHSAMYYEGPGEITQLYRSFCVPAQNSKKNETLRYYGSQSDSDCIYCNGEEYCSLYYIKYYKFCLLLLLFLLIN